MRRRTFLMLFTGVLVLIMPMPKRAIASGTLKGFCANDETPMNVNPFAPAWVNIELGAYSGRLDWDYGATKFALNLNAVEDVEIQQFLPPAMQHPAYDGWFILLNEPDLQYPNAQDAADVANRQMALVLSIDPAARFCLSVGTGINPPYVDNSYAERLIALIPPIYRPMIRAYGVTYYPYFPAPHYRLFLKRTAAWRPNKQKFILEQGIANDVPPNVTIAAAQNGTPAVTFTLANAYAELNAQGIERGAWYAQRAMPNTIAAGYNCLLDQYGLFTETGQAWSQL